MKPIAEVLFFDILKMAEDTGRSVHRVLSKRFMTKRCGSLGRNVQCHGPRSKVTGKALSRQTLPAQSITFSGQGASLARFRRGSMCPTRVNSLKLVRTLILKYFLFQWAADLSAERGVRSAERGMEEWTAGSVAFRRISLGLHRGTPTSDIGAGWKVCLTSEAPDEFRRFPSDSVGCNTCVGPGGKMPALYGRKDARRYKPRTSWTLRRRKYLIRRLTSDPVACLWDCENRVGHSAWPLPSASVQCETWSRRPAFER